MPTHTPGVSKIFGWAPEPGALDTAEGCEIALRELGEQRSRVTLAGHQRFGSEAHPYLEENRRLYEVRRAIIDRRAALLDEKDKSSRGDFARAFLRVAKQRLDRALYLSLCGEAKAVVDNYAAQPSTVANSPALEPNAGGARGMKQRRRS